MMLIALSWLGAALQIGGAVALAARILSPRASYVVMLPGAAIWLGLAVYDADWPLAAMQITFTVINVVGIVRWKA